LFQAHVPEFFTRQILVKAAPGWTMAPSGIDTSATKVALYWHGAVGGTGAFVGGAMLGVAGAMLGVALGRAVVCTAEAGGLVDSAVARAAGVAGATLVAGAMLGIALGRTVGSSVGRASVGSSAAKVGRRLRSDSGRIVALHAVPITTSPLSKASRARIERKDFMAVVP
jgi:hypothetical protein